MKQLSRRAFLKDSAKAAGVLAAPAFIPDFVTNSPNDRVNVAVVGISGDRPRVRGLVRGRGIRHIQGYATVPNVRVTTLCDIDERLFPDASAETESLFGEKPKAIVDYREVLQDDDIDIVSLATPDHWHALQTIWACQAGKHVYVEKPVSYTLSEGRKMVEAAQKYDRVVLGGMTKRFTAALNQAVVALNEGVIGNVFMAKTVNYNHRPAIGVTPEEPVPDGVHWDLFLGPAPYRPFSENRFLYNWHWMWDTGTSDFGNIGIYEIDLARWALKRDMHPVRVHATGGLFGRNDDQETPNTLHVVSEYDDGIILQSEVRNLYTNDEGGAARVTFFYGDEGWMEITGSGFRTFLGRSDEPGPSGSESDIPDDERIDGWKEFVDCVRNETPDGLRNDVWEGHMSASIVHLALASYRTGRKLTFDPETERIVGDDAANAFLSRENRAPYTMPETI